VTDERRRAKARVFPLGGKARSAKGAPMNAAGILGIASTVLAFVVFLGIVAWAYGSGRRQAFDEAANAPFALPDEADEVSRENIK